MDDKQLGRLVSLGAIKMETFFDLKISTETIFLSLYQLCNGTIK